MLSRLRVHLWSVFFSMENGGSSVKHWCMMKESCWNLMTRSAQKGAQDLVNDYRTRCFRVLNSMHTRNRDIVCWCSDSAFSGLYKFWNADTTEYSNFGDLLELERNLQPQFLNFVTYGFLSFFLFLLQVLEKRNLKSGWGMSEVWNLSIAYRPLSRRSNATFSRSTCVPTCLNTWASQKHSKSCNSNYTQTADRKREQTYSGSTSSLVSWSYVGLQHIITWTNSNLTTTSYFTRALSMKRVLQ